jgi:hypothetical protein
VPALLLAAGCEWFKPAEPERFENDRTVIPDFTTADKTLETLDLALEDKGTSNGLSVYTSSFADTTNESRGFHAFFDPATLNRMQALGVIVPADWELTHEGVFYSKLVTTTVPLSARIDFIWRNDFTEGEDERRADYAILHREYAMYYTLAETTRAVARGLATLRIERLSPTRWAIVTWQDREFVGARRDLGEISMGERRLEP